MKCSFPREHEIQKLVRSMRTNSVGSMEKKKFMLSIDRQHTFFSLKESEKNGINCFSLHKVCSTIGKMGSLCFTRVPESLLIFTFFRVTMENSCPNQVGDMLFSRISCSSFTGGKFSNHPHLSQFLQVTIGH